MLESLTHLGVGAVASGVCAAAGVLAPRLIAAVPEPEPEPQPEGESASPAQPVAEGEAEPTPVVPDKMLYVDVAARPGLAWKSAVASGIVGFGIGAALGWAWPLVYLLPLVPVGVALAVIDWHTKLLPRRIVNPAFLATIALVALGAVLTGEWSDLGRAALGWLAYGGFFALLWFIYPAGMGFGDVRLAGLLGFALGSLGWAEVVTALETTVIMGGLVSVALLLRGQRRAEYPYGPYLVIGAVVGIIWGPLWFDYLGYS